MFEPLKRKTFVSLDQIRYYYNTYSNIPFGTATAPDASNAIGDKPKAYLTVLFFDERFNFVEESSISDRVKAASDGAAALILTNIKVPKNGYAYVYLSNESAEPVYFDNMQVTHERKQIIEENHYYAYGLKIAAISSRKLGDVAEGSLKNNYLYHGDYSEYDEDIAWNDFELRNYDPQIGRWVQMDPYDQFASPYVGMGGNPIINIDPDGGWAAKGIFEGVSQAGRIAATTLGGAIIGGAVDLISEGDGGTGLIAGAGIGLMVGLGSEISINTGTALTFAGLGFKGLQIAFKDKSEGLVIKSGKNNVSYDYRLKISEKCKV